MSTLHPHNYYFSPTAQPTVCALSDEGMVYWLDNNVVKHQRNYRGQFIPLVEAPQTLPTGIPATVAPIGEAAQKIASGLAVAMLERSLAEGKSISIPSLGIVIEPDGTVAPLQVVEATPRGEGV